MPAVKNIGIVGSGAGGLTLAAMLASAGLQVEVLERSPVPSAVGSGITLQGNALRVLRTLGVWPQLQEHGWAFNTVRMRTADAAATFIAEVDDARVGGDDLPATLGMPRAELAGIVRERAQQAGARIRYRAEVTAVEQSDSGVDVATADGESYQYDLLVGADGLNSRVRAQIGIQERPRRTGMGIWRAFVPRPAEVTRTDLYYGGPAYIAGYCPTGPDTMYAYIVEDAQERRSADGPAIMAELADAYGGPWREIKNHLTASANVNYTHFTTHLIQGPWHRGRVVLIGDAAHSCPPTIAQGAAMAIEDAAVLADELLRADTLSEDLLLQFWQRRAPRAGAVVEASTLLGQWMLDHNPDADVPALMRRVAEIVKVPV